MPIYHTSWFTSCVLKKTNADTKRVWIHCRGDIYLFIWGSLAEGRRDMEEFWLFCAWIGIPIIQMTKVSTALLAILFNGNQFLTFSNVIIKNPLLFNLYMYLQSLYRCQMFKYAVVERSKIIGADVSENVKYKIELDPGSLQ